MQAAYLGWMWLDLPAHLLNFVHLTLLDAIRSITVVSLHTSSWTSQPAWKSLLAQAWLWLSLSDRRSCHAGSLSQLDMAWCANCQDMHLSFSVYMMLDAITYKPCTPLDGLLGLPKIDYWHSHGFGRSFLTLWSAMQAACLSSMLLDLPRSIQLLWLLSYAAYWRQPSSITKHY